MSEPQHQHGPGWAVTVGEESEDRRRVAESLLTVADGTTGTRGVFEEDGPGATPPVLAAGVHRMGPDGAVLPLPGPLWCALGVRAGVDAPCRRWLDLRGGVLHRDGGGVTSQRFASLARPGTLVQRTSAPEPVPVGPPLVLPPGLGPDVRTQRWHDGDIHGARVVGLGGITAVAADDRSTAADRERVDRIAVFTSAADHAPSAAVATRGLAEARACGVDRLLDEHTTAWAARWDDADVTIEGDDELQQAVRFALFHLMASVADRGTAYVAARGLTGPAYAGHVFWDAEVFVLPFLAATHPAASRAMLAYRIERLDAARARARAEGRDGARFPWESAHDGTDVTPTSWTGLDGRQIPIRTGDQEVHVSADIAWAAWQHVLWSGDEELLAGPGRGLVVDTAAWWASRIEVDRDGSGHLRGVIGPDEYHEDVDDNLFTNLMARWNLQRGADLLEAAHGDRDTAARWRGLAAKLVTGRRRPDGSHEQFRGYDELEFVDPATLAPPPFAADALLGHAAVRRTQLVKQADVLMLHHLLPNALPAGSLDADLAHYLPRTTHGSSLSPGIHASLLARTGRPEEAARWLRVAARLDLDDLTGTTAGGLHLATMGSVWQALVIGFLGARPTKNALHVDPRPLPRAWRRLTARLRFRGDRVELDLCRGRLEVRATAPVPLAVAGSRRPLTAPLVLVARGDTWEPEDRHGR